MFSIIFKGGYFLPNFEGTTLEQYHQISENFGQKTPIQGRFGTKMDTSFEVTHYTSDKVKKMFEKNLTFSN